MHSTLVKVFPRNEKYLFVIQLTKEIQEFMNFTELTVYSSNYSVYSNIDITHPTKDGVLFIWSPILPIIFDADKKPKEMIKSFPLICHAKVKLTFSSWSRVNEAIRIYYQIDQLLLETSDACAWT